MLRLDKGDIINIASIADKNAIPNASLYCATKHAVLGMTGALMLEVRNHNIRVSSISPGSVNTNFFDESENILTSDRNTILASEDIANAVWFIAKSRADFNEIEVRPANPVQSK